MRDIEYELKKMDNEQHISELLLKILNNYADMLERHEELINDLTIRMDNHEWKH